MPPCAGRRHRASTFQAPTNRVNTATTGDDVTATHQADDTTDAGSSRRNGDDYVVSDAEKVAFRRDGYVHLEGVLSEAELVGIEAVYDRFLARRDRRDR